MKVYIDGKWFSSDDLPIVIQTNETERKQIGSLDHDYAPNGIYATFPDDTPMTRVQSTMEEAVAALGTPNQKVTVTQLP